MDALLARIAAIRTWTYVSHRAGWLADPAHWQERTRGVEDRLSDALHERLTEQFVDRRATVSRARIRTRCSSRCDDAGEVLRAGPRRGPSRGLPLRSRPALRDEARGLLAAANRALRAHMGERVRACEEAPDSAFSPFARGPDPLARLRRRPSASRATRRLAPQVEALPSDLLAPSLREAVRRRLLAFAFAKVRGTLGALVRLSEAPLQGPARGIAFNLVEGLGTVARRSVAEQVRGLAGGDRRELSRLGITFSRAGVFLPSCLRPDAIRTRAALASIRLGPPAGPWPDGGPSLAAPSAASAFYTACGYLLAGPRYVRADVLAAFVSAMERAAASGPFRPDPGSAARLGCPNEEVPAVLRAVGFVERGGGFFAAGRNEGRGRTPEAQRA